MALELLTRLRESFSQRLQESNNRPWSPHHPLRHQAWQAFERLGFPTTRHEDWKYTSLAPVLRHPYRVEPPEPPVLESVLPQLPALQGTPEPHLWLVNGVPSAVSLPDGIHFQSLVHAGETGLRSPLGHLLPVEDDALVALNTALAPDVALLSVTGVSEQLLHIAVLTTAITEPQLALPRLSIRIEPHARARLLISFHSLGAHPSWTNTVAEITLGEAARAELILWETDPAQSYAITTVALELARHAAARVWTIALGGALLRNNLYIRLAGPGADAQLFGATMVSGQQVIDHRTYVEHRVEQCTSNQLYKSVADEQGTVTFTGRIHVYPGAQKTNAYQSHRAVLLSEKATVNARPQLEIYADDVRCTHGATTGALDEEALFYLRSRGLPLSYARALLLHAFVTEATATLPDESLRTRAEELIAQRAHLHAEVVP